MLVTRRGHSWSGDLIIQTTTIATELPSFPCSLSVFSSYSPARAKSILGNIEMLQRVLLATRLVAKQIRSAGLPWVWGRAKREWLTPTTGLGRSLYSGRMALSNSARTASTKQNQSIFAQATLFA